MPKLKTHHWAGLTASMKNFFGVVPGAVYGWPKNILHVHGIDSSILDLNATIRPHFAIVDAVTAMEGDGPIMGRARHVGCVAMGSDLVAVDSTVARMIGLDPRKLRYLDEAGRFLGQGDRAPHRAAGRTARASSGRRSTSWTTSSPLVSTPPDGHPAPIGAVVRVATVVERSILQHTMVLFRTR